MSSPTPPPSWYSLATALVTVVAVAIAIIPIYCPPTADPWYLPILVAGPCVATITFLDLRLYTFMGLATVTSTWMGLGVGMPAAKSKLGRFTLSALVSAFSYVPVAFYAADAYTEAWAQADDFNEVCHAAAKQKIPARLSAVFWNMAGELFSLKDCLLTQELEPGIIAYVWKPLAADFSVLRSEILSPRAFFDLPSSIWKGIVAWIEKPFFYDIKEKSDILRRFIFPLRFSLTLFAIAFSMIVWARMLGAVSDKLVSTLDSFYHQAKALVGNDGCSDDDEAPPPPMSDDREEFGVEGFQSMAERASLLDDAKMETIVFGKILLVHDVTRRVLENQKLLNQVLRDGLVLYSSLVLSAKHLHDPLASQTLSPLLGSIRELSKAIKTSADRIVSCLYDSGSTPGMLEHLPDDVHVKLQECAYNFGAFREEWIEDVMTGGNRLQGMRGTNAVRLYHTVYALAMFAERWNTLESRLHNRNAPVELVEAQLQQQQQQPEPAQRALMVLRSRSNIVQQ
ncbi:hypothetical protein FOZ60_010849 [Perkinsus olseni]|uniref:Uncharacterized protein n=1 Tax=Perkinsus olseni TaxID=32597 RepID=A0A7J6PBC2_PEROL|nr:hypothetical protein FOZ60_010849 [Perkinsus olseni]